MSAILVVVWSLYLKVIFCVVVRGSSLPVMEYARRVTEAFSQYVNANTCLHLIGGKTKLFEVHIKELIFNHVWFNFNCLLFRCLPIHVHLKDEFELFALILLEETEAHEGNIHLWYELYCVSPRSIHIEIVSLRDCSEPIPPLDISWSWEEYELCSLLDEPFLVGWLVSYQLSVVYDWELSTCEILEGSEWIINVNLESCHGWLILREYLCANDNVTTQLLMGNFYFLLLLCVQRVLLVLLHLANIHLFALYVLFDL